MYGLENRILEPPLRVDDVSMLISGGVSDFNIDSDMVGKGGDKQRDSVSVYITAQ